MSNLPPPELEFVDPPDVPPVENEAFFQKNNSGLVAFITTGTPVVHLAVTEVDETT